MLRATAFVLAALLAVSGCMTEPEDVPLSGTWTGTAVLDGTAVSFVWELRESGGVIAGSASFSYGSLTYTFTGDVTGSYIHPDVRMTLVLYFEPGDTLDLRWAGTRISDDLLDGVLHYPDGGTSMTLRRG